MARGNLERLIEQVRTLTGAGDEFSDDDIQAMLDVTRVHHRYTPLRPDDPHDADPTDWLSREDSWEDGYELVDGDYDVLAEATTGDTSEPLIGRFVLATANRGPVLITGRTYDINAAAASLLTAWAAKVAIDFDFSADGQSFSRSQKREALLEMAAEFRRRSRPRYGRLVRPDEEG